jgi:glutamyl-tRNA synthetase
MKTLTEAAPLVDWAFVDGDKITYPDSTLMVPKKMSAEQAAVILRRGAEIISKAEPFDTPTLEAAFRAAAESAEVKVGPFLQPFRVALTGKTVAPPLFESMVVLGREETLRRLGNALAALEESAKQAPPRVE